MADVATIQAQIENLKTAIASGVTSIREGDSLTVYDGIDGMQRRLEFLRSQLAQAIAGKTEPTRRTRIRYGYQLNKGYASYPWPRQ